MTAIVAGADGGGTRTRVALASVEGRLLGIGEAGSGNYHDVGSAGFAANLNLALERARVAAGCAAQPLAAIFLGLGSIVTPEDKAAIRAVVEVAPWAPRDRIGVDHDLRIAHQGCLGGREGIVIIAGTGSSCYGRDAEGRCWKSGGWGPTLDDVGSGHWLGLQAMIATTQEFDGRGPATKLTPAVLAGLSPESPLHLLARVELDGMTRSEIAELARLVVAEAEQGDAVARGIIDAGVAELAELAATVSHRLAFDDVLLRIPVAATGGLVDAGEAFLGPLRAALAARLPKAELVAGQAPPVLGAVLLAIEMLAPTCDPQALLARLQSPPAVETRRPAPAPSGPRPSLSE